MPNAALAGTASSQQQSSKPQQEQQQSSSARSAPAASGAAAAGGPSPQTFARQLHTALLQGIVSMLRADSFGQLTCEAETELLLYIQRHPQQGCSSHCTSPAMQSSDSFGRVLSALEPSRIARSVVHYPSPAFQKSPSSTLLWLLLRADPAACGAVPAAVQGWPVQLGVPTPHSGTGSIPGKHWWNTGSNGWRVYG
jgi:hypothetical protein